MQREEMYSFDFCLVEEEAKALYRAVLEFLPDVETFQNEVLKAKPLPDCLEDNQQAVLKRLLVLLQALRSQISQMKSDMTGLREDLRKTTHCVDGTDHSILTTPVFKIETSDDHEDNLESSNYPTSGFSGEQENIVKSYSAYDAAVKSVKLLNNQPPPSCSSQTQIMKTGKSICHICGDKINDRFHHMKKYHPFEKNFPCRKCGMAFDDFQEFHKHKQTHLANRLFHCDLCNKTTKTRQGMLVHIIAHKGIKPYTCDVCGKSFRFKSSSITCTHGRAIQAVSSITKYRCGFQCKTCGERLDTSDFMDRPIDEQYSLDDIVKSFPKTENNGNSCMHDDIKKIYFCNFCPKAYAEVRKLRQHENFHIGIKLYKCDACGEKFYTGREKKRHMYVKHSGEFPGLKCKICGEMCRSILGRETHYLTHTPEERSMYNVVIKMSDCDICGKTVRRNNLAHHKLTHSSKNSFICEVCGKGLKSKKSLKTHALVHMKPEDRPPRKPASSQPRQKPSQMQPAQKKIYQCDTCFRWFSQRQALEFHKITHTKVKAFKCNECGMSFTLPGNLKRHSIVHTGQKPFQCDFCGRGFAQKVTLDVHRRIHTGEKPYQCNHCGKRFSDPSTLYKHKAKHEKDLVHSVQSL